MTKVLTALEWVLALPGAILRALHSGRGYVFLIAMLTVVVSLAGIANAVAAQLAPWLGVWPAATVAGIGLAVVAWLSDLIDLE